MKEIGIAMPLQLAQDKYVTDENTTYASLGREFGIPLTSLWKYAKKNNWKEKRQAYKEAREDRVGRLSLKALERERVRQVGVINKALIFLNPYIQGLLKPKSYITAVKSYTELTKVGELLQGRATDIILSEHRDKRMLEVIHRLKGIDVTTRGEVTTSEVATRREVTTLDSTSATDSPVRNTHSPSDSGELIGGSRKSLLYGELAIGGAGDTQASIEGKRHEEGDTPKEGVGGVL